MDLRHSHRIFVADKLTQGVNIATSTEQAHHLLHVLRLKTGDVLRLFNCKDGEYRASIAGTGKRSAQIAVHEQLRPQKPETDLWLCPAPIKKTHFDYMMEKATELGVSEIQPILTGRTQVREINADRIYGICREAAEQCGRLTIPAIGLPVSLTDFVDVFPEDRAAIICAEWGDATTVRDALQSPVLAILAKAAIITGPEGGFTAEDFALLRKMPNACFVRLGPRILRADTAAIAALTCWQAIKGDWLQGAAYR